MVKEEDSRNTSMTDLRYHGLRTHGIYVVAIVLQFQAFFLKVLCTHALMSAQHSRWFLSFETLSEAHIGSLLLMAFFGGLVTLHREGPAPA